MREIFGNMWEVNCDATCITTNGIIKRDGNAVMGAGIAKQAVDKFPGIDRILGCLLKLNGNRVNLLLETPKVSLVSFPTKNNWKDDSSLELIVRSSEQLKELTEAKGWTKVILPRPGCGNGNLRWETVKPRLVTILDDRFFIIAPSRMAWAGRR